MRKLLYIEWSKLKGAIIGTIVMGLIASSILVSIIYKDYALETQMEVWEVGFEFFNFIFPILAVVPTCWLLYFEKKNGFIQYTLPRVSKRKYLLSKWLLISGGAFSILFIISFGSVLVSLYVVPPIDPVYGLIDPSTGEPSSRYPEDHFAGEWFLNRPLMYGLFLSLWKGALSIFIATMGFLFSLYSRNLFVILTGPFVYTVVENFTLAVLRLEKYRLVTAFEPTSITHQAVTTGTFIFAPLLLVLFCSGYVLVQRYILKKSVYAR